MKRARVITLAVAGLLCVVASDATAGDEKAYSGAICRGSNSEDADDLEAYPGYVIATSNVTNVACPIVRDDLDGTELDDIWIYLDNASSSYNFDCYVWSCDTYAANCDSELLRDTGSGYAIMWSGLDDFTEYDYRNWNVTCALYYNDKIFRIRYDEV